MKKLQDDGQLNGESAGYTLFSQIHKELQKSPKHPLVIVIDALDECGDARAQRKILRTLFDASSQLPWLKVIITSRQEQDIETFFQEQVDCRLYLSRDLVKDEQAQEDIHLFAKHCFSDIGIKCHLGSTWPKQALLQRIVARARGLFIYVETARRLVEKEADPEKRLIEVTHETSEGALGGLYKLYSTAIESQIGEDKEAFRRVVGIIIAVASYRPLCDAAVATLAGLKPHVVRTWVDRLNSLLYRDGNASGGIRARHLSIINFLTGLECPKDFQVDIKQANLDTGLGCLRIMIDELKFNICRLETSLISNNDVEDLEDRIQTNISDALQYSCIHWSSHVCSVPYSTDSVVAEQLGNFFKNEQPLYWMEVLSILGKVGVGMRGMRGIISWAKVSIYRVAHYQNT